MRRAMHNLPRGVGNWNGGCAFALQSYSSWGLYRELARDSHLCPLFRYSMPSLDDPRT